MNKKNILLYIGILLVIILIVGAAIFIINKKSSIKMNTADTGQVLEPIKSAESGDLILVHYTGTLENGTKFDSSYDRGQPFGFLLGQQMVIKGWDEGLVGVKRGDKKHLVITGDKAYGDQDVKGADGKVIIPKNATLIFDIEVVEVMDKAKVEALIKERQAAQAATADTEKSKISQ